MRRAIVLTSLVLILTVGPICACAQGFLCGKNLSSCSDPGLRAVEVYAGLVTNADMTQVVGRTRDPGRPWFDGFDGDNRYTSLYAALALPVSLGRMGTFRASAGIGVPAVGLGQVYNDFDNDGVLNWTAKYDADTYWATIEGLLSCPVGYNFCALAGFRWDYWQTSYNNPYDTNPAAGTVAPWYLTVNGFVPLVGLVTEYQGLSFGAVGFPFMPGTMDIEDPDLKANGTFDNGYYVEIFTEYVAPMFDMGGDLTAAVSFFGKINIMGGASAMTFTDNNNVDPDEIFDVSVGRTLFLVGVKADFKFNLPTTPDIFGSLL